ncbi:hypothetical protein Tco_0661528 [Tanacetum coccineum]
MSKGTDISKLIRKPSKNGQAQTRESEEYKKKPKNQSRSQEVKDRSQIQSTWSTADSDIQEKEQKESQKQAIPSTEWKGQSQKSSQVKKIRLEGLKLPNLKLYYKVIRKEGSKLQTG